MIIKFDNFRNYLTENNARLIKSAACIFFIIGILMSNDLWITHRNFPTIPLFEYSISLSKFTDTFLYYLLLTLLFIVSLSKNRVFLFVLFMLLFFILIQDQMRWQPWVYTYILVLIPFSARSNLPDKYIIKYLQLLFIGIYLWSGIHKMNPNFNELIVESISISFFKINDSSLITFIKSIGAVFAFIEILIGLLLIFPKTRKLGLYGIISMHILILFYISPLGINYNHIILPWNLFMITSVILLFSDSKDHLQFWKGPLTSKTLNSFLLLVMILPLLNFFNLWDSFMSFSIYSGKIDNYYILIEDGHSEELNILNLDEYLMKTKGLQGGEILDINRWSQQVLKIPMYPEKRLFKKIANSFCLEQKNNSKLIFLTTTMPLWKFLEFDQSNRSIQKPVVIDHLNELYFLKFKQPIKIDNFNYFDCEKLIDEN